MADFPQAELSPKRIFYHGLDIDLLFMYFELKTSSRCYMEKIV